MKHAKNVLRNQSGFTLIEIIAVLILLGILSAVAVPKYIDLQTEAKKKAVEAAVAEGVAQVNQYAAKCILTTGAVPADLSALTTAGLVTPYNAGDFSITFADDTGGILVTATGTGTSVTGAIGSRVVPLPK
jgi:prepilin-type N-terminal cleavage/methylation domain-containing protein